MKKLILITLIMAVAAISIAATGTVTTTVMTPRFLAYSTATQLKLNAKIDAANPVYSGALTSNAADGTHYVQPYNSVAFSGTPSTGMIQTNSSGIQYYNGSTWVTPVTDISSKTDVTRFTRYSSAHTSGGGTVNNYYGGGGSGQTVSEVSANQNINRGLYVVNSVGGKQLTFQNHSSGKTSVFNSYSSVYLKPDGAGSNFKFGAYTTGHGHSIRLSTGWYEAVAWNTPLFQFVMYPAGGITKTGVNEYAVVGGSYIVDDGFEGTGLPATANGVTWTNGGDSSFRPDFDYATAPAPLAGAQSMKVGFNGVWALVEFAPQTDVYVAFKTNGSLASRYFVTLNPAANAGQFGFATNNFKFKAPNATEAFVGTFAINTTYYIKLHWTSSNSTLTFRYSSDGVSWGTLFTSNGSSAAALSQIRFGYNLYGGAEIIDSLRVSTSDINW